MTKTKRFTCGMAATSVLFGETPPKPHPPVDVATIAASGARQIQYQEHDIISLAAKLRFTTLIRLPKGEQILDFLCGDKEFWQVTGVQNFAFVKPSKAGASTSLHLVTAAGTVYAFVLTEVGDTRHSARPGDRCCHERHLPAQRHQRGSQVCSCLGCGGLQSAV